MDNEEFAFGYEFVKKAINKLFLNLWCGLPAFINRFCLHLQHLAFRMALLPFYLPKRIWKLFFRSEGIIF